MTEQTSPSHNPLAEKVAGPNSSSVLKKRILQVLNNRIWHINITILAYGPRLLFLVLACTYFFIIAMAFEIAPVEVVFSGFHSSDF